MHTQLGTKIIYGEYEIPVRLCTMIKEIDRKTEGCCVVCHGKIKQQKSCAECGREHTWKEPLTAYRFDKDNIHVITDEDKEALKIETKEIIVLGSIPVSSIDVKLYLGGYYLGVAKPTSQAKEKKAQQELENKTLFQVLFNGLVRSEKGIVVKFATGSKQQLGVLLADDLTNTIILKKLAYNVETKEMDEEQISAEIDEEQILMGEDFVNSLKEINPRTVENDFLAIYEKILKGEEIPVKILTAPSLNFFKQKK